MKKRALISVSNKDGVVDFAKGLITLGYEIISTGGTAKTLSEAGVANIGVSDITGFGECLDGRVKTLHPAVHAGLLAMRSNPEHMRQLEDLKINTIDVVAVNLYPFKETILKPGVTLAEAIENIDIGGPTMLRSAAKNYQDVVVVVDPADYSNVLQKLSSGTVDLDYKFRLMYKVFSHTAVYDSMISTYMRTSLGIEFGDEMTFAYQKKQDLRYGENPHQNGAFYAEYLPIAGSLAEAQQLGGKELSYNNINDANGALDLLREFTQTAVVAIKHANPCGVGIGSTVLDAYKIAYDCDPISIYGGIVACNKTIDAAAATEMIKIFLEIVIAPDFTADALEIFKKKPNLRVLRLADINSPVDKNSYEMKKIYGGLLIQNKDLSLYNKADLKVVTTKAPSADELEQLDFAYKVVKHSKSNAIAIAKNFAAIGIGAGQTNRIWAANQAIEHAGAKVKGSVLASDAFFPFSDCVQVCADAGITAIIQPGGSIRDQDSIDLCNKYNISMVFVSQRHFKH